jgi:tRNA1(Val) A37 N6-methylase TrmN6
MAPERDLSDITQDAVLGGQLLLRQPRRGHRVGHDAILLAAATAAADGEHAVEFGAGVGAAGLALALRVPGLKVTLVEIDRTLAELASENARLNALHDRTAVFSLDVCEFGAFAAAGFGPASIDQVLMNPPFNDPARQNLSPDPQRRHAHAAGPRMLALWIDSAARLLSVKGGLTLIWRADGLTAVLDALAKDFGGIAIVPVYPREGEPAIRILVRAVKASRAPLTLCPGVVLNDRFGQPTSAAETILRDGKALTMAIP